MQKVNKLYRQACDVKMIHKRMPFLFSLYFIHLNVGYPQKILLLLSLSNQKCILIKIIFLKNSIEKMIY